MGSKRVTWDLLAGAGMPRWCPTVPVPSSADRESRTRGGQAGPGSDEGGNVPTGQPRLTTTVEAWTSWNPWRLGLCEAVYSR
jgi:hypothetical protein